MNKIEYVVRVAIVDNNSQKNHLGFYEPKVLEKTFNEGNPINDRKEAISRYNTWFDIFEDSSKEGNNFAALYDTFELVEGTKVAGKDDSIANIDLYINIYNLSALSNLTFNNVPMKELFSINLPFRNRVLFSNSVFDFEQIKNQHIEYIYYQKAGLNHNGTKQVACLNTMLEILI